MFWCARAAGSRPACSGTPPRCRHATNAGSIWTAISARRPRGSAPDTPLEPPQVLRQLAQRHGARPVVRTEIGVRAAVDENDAAAEEIGGIGEHEADPLGELTGIAETA